MCGRATLVTVTSRTCITVTSMIEPVIVHFRPAPTSMSVGRAAGTGGCAGEAPVPAGAGGAADPTGPGTSDPAAISGATGAAETTGVARPSALTGVLRGESIARCP